MAADPYRYFRLEAREILDQFGQALLALEADADASSAIQRMLRLAHTLKGAARVVKQGEIADHAHAVEDDLAPYRELTARAPPALVAAVARRLADIQARLANLGGAEPPTAAAAGEAAQAPVPARPAAETQMVRADLAEMDALLDGVSEAQTLLNGLRPVGPAAEQGRHLADLLLDQLASRGPLAMRSPAYATAEALRRTLADLERGLGAAVDQIDRELRQLRGAAEQLRLTPAATLLFALEQTARETARALGKTVSFKSEGRSVRLDAYVLSSIQTALVQIVRNAVAHGIEPPQERERLGKPAQGQISVRVLRRGRRIVFECHDDGRGLDVEAIRAIAIERGLLAADAPKLGVEEVTRLLLKGGISTAAQVTDSAGRGVGLDVVREAIERLGGEATVRSEPGVGTTFELVAPLSVAALDALAVEIDGAAVAIPLDAVRQSLLVTRDEISRDDAGSTIVFEGKVIPYLSMPRALFGAGTSRSRTRPVVVIAGADGMAAAGVDRLLGPERVVMRPLPAFAQANAMVAAASLDAAGEPQLVLDPDGLVAEARRGGLVSLEPDAERLPVLVVDDSLTTRMLEQGILESAGYTVELATSAEEGLEMARSTPHLIFLVDVEMPGMDGFSFVEETKRDPVLRDTPTILITSRNAPEDYERGRNAGAAGYVVKSEFNQVELLALITRLGGQR